MAWCRLRGNIHEPAMKFLKDIRLSSPFATQPPKYPKLATNIAKDILGFCTFFAWSTIKIGNFGVLFFYDPHCLDPCVGRGHLKK